MCMVCMCMYVCEWNVFIHVHNLCMCGGMVILCLYMCGQVYNLICANVCVRVCVCEFLGPVTTARMFNQFGSGMLNSLF